MDLRPLEDRALLTRLEALVGQERESTADIIEHLAELDRRGVIADTSYPSLFSFCREKLGYSEAAAFYRIRAARAAREFPRILDDVRRGVLHLEAVVRLYPHLRQDNSDAILNQAAGATKRQVLSLVARLEEPAPAPDMDVIRFLPAPAPPPAAPALSEAATPPEGPAPEIIPPPQRVRLSFTASDAFLTVLDRLRSLRRHKFPEGRLEDLLMEAAQAQVERLEPKAVGRQPSPTGKRSRRVPAAVRSEVWKRDGGRCAFIGDDGRRCESRDFLEYDHIVPWADGGRSDDAGNIRLLCRPHNQRLARRRFGPRARQGLR